MVNLSTRDLAERISDLVGEAISLIPEEASDDLKFVLDRIKDISEEYMDYNSDYEDIVKQVREKHPDRELYVIPTLHSGHIVVTPQDIGNVRRVSEKTQQFTKEQLDKYGGYETLMKTPEGQQRLRDIDQEAGDMNNNLILEECVLYPEDFKQQLENNKVKSGLYLMILDKISEISEWADVQVTKV